MNVKNGFSTLNRLLGKKNKNGHNLSKSTTNLSLSLAPSNDGEIISSHQEQHNRITPIPVVATNNAPFEQSFRITVLLPRGQLYVSRLGAKTKLEKLLELVCENKQLDPEKYEFRHPVDASQVFSNELTIGAVGLTEIRLCNKSEAYDSFDPDEIIKLRHTGRDSLSSSEMSSRTSKHTLKTASPYSSTNSLNSIDSTGMNTSYRSTVVASLPPQSVIGLQHQQQQHQQNSQVKNGHHHFQPPVAPARKKRVAPRPPSQNSIPEKEILAPNGSAKNPMTYSSKQEPQIPRKEFHVSSPNLSQCNEINALRKAEFHKSNVSVDCNGNTNNSYNNNFNNSNSSDGSSHSHDNSYGDDKNGYLNHNGHDVHNGDHLNGFKTVNVRNRPVSMNVLNHDSTYNDASFDSELSGNHFRYNGGSIPNIKSEENGEFNGIPAPAPRKKIVIQAKKKAPAPPPRGLPPPIASPRVATIPAENEPEPTEEDLQQSMMITQTNKRQLLFSQNDKDIQPDHTTTFNEINTNEIIPENTEITSPASTVFNAQNKQFNNKKSSESTNSSLSVLSVNSTPEKGQSSLSSTTDTDKQITEMFEIALKSVESSSDDEENIKVYNLKLGKTIVKPLSDCKNVDEAMTQVCKNESVVTTKAEISETPVPADTSSIRSDSPAWTYTIPAPPNFADTQQHNDISKMSVTTSDLTIATDVYAISTTSPDDVSSSIDIPDEPITPIIKERQPVDFEVFTDTSTIATTNTTGTNDGGIITITSDIEDGYHGGLDKSDKKLNQQKILQNLDIENSKILEKNQKMMNKLEDDSFVESAVNEHHEEIVDDFARTTRNLSPPNSIESYDSNKIDVISELNDVINKNSIDTVIRKNDDNGEIESVKPYQTLSNFKIQTYNNSNMNGMKTDDDNNENNIFNTNQKLNESKSEIIDISNNTKNQIDDKFIKKPLNAKRNSLTLSNNVSSQLFRTPGIITRSDSFHSTQYLNSVENYDKFQSRSSSYLSLIGAQQQQPQNGLLDRNDRFLDTNRRKSSSELSIGESPSLQSLIVMKSILSNSRKNSLNNDIINSTTIIANNNNHTTINSTYDDEIDSKHVAAQNDMATKQNGCAEKFIINNKNDNNLDISNNSSTKNSPKNNTLTISQPDQEKKQDEKHNVNIDEKIEKHSNNNNNNIKNNTETTDDQPPERRWKYQGPPSINLSTWSERPKVQVAIKNDSDYKLGVGTVNPAVCALPRGYRNSTHLENYVSNTKSNDPINNKLSGSGTNNEQPKVPFVRSVEYKKSMSVVQQPTTNTTITTIENSNSNIDINQQKESDTQNMNNNKTIVTNTINFSNPLNSSSNTMTLGRMPKINRTIIVPTVKSFKILDNTTTTTTTPITITNNTKASAVTRTDLNGQRDNNIHTKDDQQIYKNNWRVSAPPASLILQNSTNNGRPLERSNSQVLTSTEKNVLKFSTYENTSSINNHNNNNKSLNYRDSLKISTHLSNGSKDKDPISSTQVSAPFSQITLRRTGLKEKIIAANESSDHVPKNPKILRSEKQNCAKLELKLTNVTPTKSKVVTTPVTPTPPPPPPPIIRSVVTKQNSFGNHRQQHHQTSAATSCSVVDPRNELLSAIRNFNKNTLKG